VPHIGGEYKKLTYPAIENDLLRCLLLPNPCIRDSFGVPGLQSRATVFEVGSCRLLHPFVSLHPWQSHNSNSLPIFPVQIRSPRFFTFLKIDPPVCLLFPIDLGFQVLCLLGVLPDVAFDAESALIFSSSDMALPHWLPSSTSASASEAPKIYLDESRATLHYTLNSRLSTS